MKIVAGNSGKLIFLVVGLLLTAGAVGAPALEGVCKTSVALKLSVTASGAYRIPGTALREAFGCDPLTPDRLKLSNMGEQVPHLALGGDLVFVGRHLAGERSYNDEFTLVNVYWLTITDSLAPELEAIAGSGGERQASALVSRSHLEQDAIRVRFSGRTDEPQPEVWYWARLNSIDPKPLVVPLDLSGWRADSRPTIRVALRGWSRLPGRQFGDLPDHRVDVLLNDHPIGAGEWQDQEEHVIVIDDVPAEVVRPGSHNRLALRVPERNLADEPLPAIDAVLLNWIEVEYRHRGAFSEGQHSFRVAHRDGGWFRISTPSDDLPIVISQAGHLLAASQSVRLGQRSIFKYATVPGVEDYVAVVGDAFYHPDDIVADRPSDLRDTAQQADYLVLSHRRLLPAIEPLAEFHRRGGLTVKVIDVEDVYDEFNHGVLAPAAIRDFIDYAYHQWQGPRPRFVLLVGDASWDVQHETGNDRAYADWTFDFREKGRFIKNSSLAYEGDRQAAGRNLMPTWPVDTYQGYAASDNVFVAVDGDDFLPDLAIGRFPVTEPEEVSAIVNKTIAYHRHSEVGPWRRKVLWITNEQPGMQRTSDRLDGALAQLGFAGTKVYPSKEEKDNARHQATLQSAFDEGQLLVHFLGHGGRYIWRTGPPDFRKNHDLFTLDHLEELAPTPRLPFVLSMTCYSAPFDHPTADSIGEKFLRLPDRGAIGILAASWRNSPSASFSQAILDELARPGSIGVAVMRAKRSQKNRLMVETYNLLGDPAARLALPRYHLGLETRDGPDGLEIEGRVEGSRFSGQVLIDWESEQGDPIGSQQLKLHRGEFWLRLKRKPERTIGLVRAYAWNQARGIDALGAVAVAPSEVAAASPAGQDGSGR